MRGENATPITQNLDNDEDPDNSSVLKKCLSESRHDEYFSSDRSKPNLLESLPDSPVSLAEDHDRDEHNETIFWSNPAFCCGDDTSDEESCAGSRSAINSESVYGCTETSGQICDSFSSAASSEFSVKSKLRALRISATPINISINVTVKEGAPEYRRACGERIRAKNPPPKNAGSENFPVRRSSYRPRIEPGTTMLDVKGEEAKIRAELAREIEKSLEVEIKQQICQLNRRLEELHAHQKPEIVHRVNNQSSVSKGLRDDTRIRADYHPGKKFDWVKTLRSGSAEADNYRKVDPSVAPERSESEPRRRRVSPRSLHSNLHKNISPCKSEDDIAVHESQTKFSRCGKGNFNHLEEPDKLEMSRSSAGRSGKGMGKFFPSDLVNKADRICDGAAWGFNNAKKVQFFIGNLRPTNSPGCCRKCLG